MSESKYTVTVYAKKAAGDQYEKAPALIINADHGEELRNSIDALLGQGTADRLVAKFIAGTVATEPAVTVTQVAAPLPLPTAVPAAPAALPVPQPAPQPAQAPAPQGPQVTYGPCPECRTGTLVLRNRRDGSGQFIGCSRYRRDGTGCSYIYQQ